MPFKSEAQRKKFHQLRKAGKMSQSTIDKWEEETGGKKLPKRVKKKKKSPKKKTKTQTRRR